MELPSIIGIEIDPDERIGGDRRYYVYATWEGSTDTRYKFSRLTRCPNCNQVREIDNYCSNCGALMYLTYERW